MDAAPDRGARWSPYARSQLWLWLIISGGPTIVLLGNVRRTAHLNENLFDALAAAIAIALVIGAILVLRRPQAFARSPLSLRESLMLWPLRTYCLVATAFNLFHLAR